jgi:ketosteroid isomerase-like protein
LWFAVVLSTVRHVRLGECEGATMGHPNEDLIRQGYDAFGRGDMDTLRALFDPDIVWHAPGRSQLAGDHQGVDAVLGYSSTRARSGWTVRCPAPMGAVADRAAAAPRVRAAEARSRGGDGAAADLAERLGVRGGVPGAV